MKKLHLAIIALLFAGTSSFAQSAEDTKKWMEYMTPSEMHQMMAHTTGTWKEILNMWMAPDTPPQQMEATATNSMILGDRYQESIHTGSMNGMPFEGRSLTAFDNARKVFISTWVDNMGTGITYLEGTYNAKTKTITLSGKAVDPMSGKELPMKQTLTFVDDNTQKMEIYNTTASGVTFKSVEAILTRI